MEQTKIPTGWKLLLPSDVYTSNSQIEVSPGYFVGVPDDVIGFPIGETPNRVIDFWYPHPRQWKSAADGDDLVGALAWDGESWIPYAGQSIDSVPVIVRV